MLDRLTPRGLPAWPAPLIGWLTIAVLYLLAAALTVLLAVAMDAWWLLLLTVTAIVVAAMCVRAGLSRRSPAEPGHRAADGSVGVPAGASPARSS